MPWVDEQGAGHVVERDDGVMILAIHVRVMVWRGFFMFGKVFLHFCD